MNNMYLSTEQMMWLTVFGAPALIFFITWLIIKRSVLSKKDNCSACTKGTVVDYTLAEYGDCGIHLPVVEYEVDGQKYRQTGPKYSYATSIVATPFIKETTCEYTTDIYSQVFKVKYRCNSFGYRLKNPMKELFPLGTEIDVFYDPMKPKRAYVLRLHNLKAVSAVFLIIALSFAAAAVCLSVLM